MKLVQEKTGLEEIILDDNIVLELLPKNYPLGWFFVPPLVVRGG